MVIDAKYKSLFIFPAVGVTMVLFGVSVFAALLGGNEATAWLGAAIASVPLPVIATYLMFGGVERTSENFPFMLLIAAAGVMVHCGSNSSKAPPVGHPHQSPLPPARSCSCTSSGIRDSGGLPSLHFP